MECDSWLAMQMLEQNLDDGNDRAKVSVTFRQGFAVSGEVKNI